MESNSYDYNENWRHIRLFISKNKQAVFMYIQPNKDSILSITLHKGLYFGHEQWNYKDIYDGILLRTLKRIIKTCIFFLSISLKEKLYFNFYKHQSQPSIFREKSTFSFVPDVNHKLQIKHEMFLTHVLDWWFNALQKRIKLFTVAGIDRCEII